MKKQFRVIAMVLTLLMVVAFGLTACVEGGESPELTSNKAALCQGLDNHHSELVANNVYTEANLAILLSLLTAGKAGINAASNVDEAQAAYESARTQLSSVETDPLPSAIKTAQNDIDKYLAQKMVLFTYTAANKTQLQNRVDQAKAAIGNAQTVAEIPALLAAGKTALDQVTGEKATLTYNTYTAVSPSNWNELTYQDSNDTQIMSYISSNFFEFNFAFDSQGNIIDGMFTVDYSMATGLEDVSQSVDAKWGIPEDVTGRAWKITLRDDLRWDDGTPIDASDYVYTMQQQLDPLFKNYRADSYYVGSTVITNASKYVFQGDTGSYSATTAFTKYDEAYDDQLIFALGYEGKATPDFPGYIGFPTSYTTERIIDYMAANYGFNKAVVTKMIGKTFAQIKADPEMYAEWQYIYEDFWGNIPDEQLHFFIVEDFVWPTMNFSDVGIFVGDNKYEIILVLEKELHLLKDDGTLSYLAAYNMASLPLVKKDLYESCKIAPVAGSKLWTSKYNSSVATSASFGPYKLTTFQAGKQYILSRNDNWFGYDLPQYAGQYQTSRIVCETIAEWNTAWLKFLKGELDGISINVTIADEYKNSERAYFTPDDFVNSLQLQSSYEALKGRESAGINKTILAQQDFRNAISLAIDREAYNRECTTSSLPGFGLFGPVHYYDVANGGVFRNTDIAKETLLQTYGFSRGTGDAWTDGTNNYPDMETAYRAITGFDLVKARQLVTSAYNAALAAGDIKAGDKVQLVYGTGADNSNTRRAHAFLERAFTAMCVGTPLEGRFELLFENYETTWSTSFRSGAYDICAGGWSGAAWDPGYFLLAYLSPSYMYSTAWDTASEQMTLVVPGSNDGQPITMGLLEWYDALNGKPTKGYNWGKNVVEEDVRLVIISALEKVVLGKYYSLPISYSYTASLITYKAENVTYTYNTFMAYGGLRYRTYNYNDQTWMEYVSLQGGQLNYK